MSYWQMDDGFLGHHKTVRALRAGTEALHMWVALRTYVALNNSDGFIPDEDIDDLPHAPKNPRKWLKVLLECGKPIKGGGRGAGLIDETDGGWALHNYEKHGLSAAEIKRRQTEARERKQRWRERVENASGTRSGTRDERVTEPIGGTRDGRPPIPSHPTPGEDPPTPLGPVAARPPAEDVAALTTAARRAEESFSGAAPEQRADVAEVHEIWRRVTGYKHHKFRAPFDAAARAVASAIDAETLANCKTVAEFCMNDGMVNGKLDDKRQKHDSLEYIFDKPHVFHRILKAAIDAGHGGTTKTKRSAREAVAAAKAIGSGA